MLVQLRGFIVRKRKHVIAANSPVAELNAYGSFSGRAYQDLDLNGRFDAGVDLPQSSAKVRVDGNLFAVTDPEGYFRIDNVRVGEHTVNLDLLTVRADLTLLDKAQQTVTLSSGRDLVVDFRLVRTGRISGVAWLDSNANGVLDEGEQPLGDVRIVAGGSHDTVTNADGTFTLADLPPGEYVVLVDEKTLAEKTSSLHGTLTTKVVAGKETGNLNFAITPAPPEVKQFPAAPEIH